MLNALETSKDTASTTPPRDTVFSTRAPAPVFLARSHDTAAHISVCITSGTSVLSSSGESVAKDEAIAGERVPLVLGRGLIPPPLATGVACFALVEAPRDATCSVPNDRGAPTDPDLGTPATPPWHRSDGQPQSLFKPALQIIQDVLVGGIPSTPSPVSGVPETSRNARYVQLGDLGGPPVHLAPCGLLPTGRRRIIDLQCYVPSCFSW